MSDLSGYPYLEVHVRKSGALHDAADLERAKDFVADHGITDLFVVSHGWNNDMAEARKLYADLFESVRAVADTAVDVADRAIGVLGILWPSKKFAEQDLIPAGGAAALGGDQPDSDLERSLDEFAALHDDAAAIATARAAIADLDTSPDARAAFADAVRSLLPPGFADADDASDRFLAASPEELFDRLEAPLLPQAPTAGGGGAAGGAMGIGGGAMGAGGGAAGLGDWFSGAKAAARRILNLGTYYTMKARAGAVGADGVQKIVAAVKVPTDGPKVHFVGHSFGGRVVTAASKALGDTGGPRPDSMSLLQAAFSHNGFAENFHAGKDGFFRSVLGATVVHGPVIVTHTHNDKANALAYPLASRLAGQDAAAIGGPGDRYGAIGANGAQHTPEAQDGTLLAVGASGYALEAGKLYNLEANAFIKDHGDVKGKEVAFAILSAVATT